MTTARVIFRPAASCDVAGVVGEGDAGAQLGGSGIEMAELSFGDSDRPLHARLVGGVGRSAVRRRSASVTNTGRIGFDVVAELRHAHLARERSRGRRYRPAIAAGRRTKSLR